MKHDRAYKRRMTRLKNRRRKEMCEYIPFWRNIWFDKDKQRVVAASDWHVRKKFAKTHASRAHRRDPIEQTKGCAYKKVYNVRNQIC